ncbi:hypothetical protein HYZ70_02315 [Candidatus Curtissbacteria bacterium]|nr:hypothetical protein [Candidatus Curtissbacteria bacterium]
MSFPYKYHLKLASYRKGYSFWRKLMAAMAALTFMAGGTVSALYYQYQKEAPARQEYQYLSATSTDFYLTSRSISELLEAFSIAGEKTTKIDTLAESSQSASGFFVALDDLERNLAKIEATGRNLAEKELNLSSKAVPEKLTEQSRQILDFYREAQTVLSDLYENHLFAKQLLLTMGPKFYLPSLVESGLWETGSKEQILDYYNSAKEETNTALSELAKLSPPDHLIEYYDSQIAYLTILVNLSDNIINTLSLSDDKDEDSATQIEKAYQLLVGAQRENEALSKKLLEEKLKIVDVRKNLNKLSAIKIRENSIWENLELAASVTPKVEEPNYLRFLRDRRRSASDSTAR